MAKFGRLTDEEAKVYSSALSSAILHFSFTPGIQRGMPWIAPVATMLYPIAVPEHLKSELPTLAVDKDWRLYINFDFFNSLNRDEQVFVLQHEAWHVLFGHHSEELACLPSQERVNLAGDLQINSMLGREFNPTEVHPEALKAEEHKGFWYYYDKLEGKDQNNSSCSGGSGAGNEQPWEEELGEGAPKRAEVEKSEAVKEVARQARAAAANRQAGDGSDTLSRWADEVLAPRVDWRSELKSHVQKISRMKGHGPRATYSRLSRRRGLPGQQGPKSLDSRRLVSPSYRMPLPTVAFAQDTSGSMENTKLAGGLAEVASVLKRVGEVTYFSVDSSIQNAKKIRGVGGVDLQGGGGTDMGEAIRWVKDNYHDILVIVTDGETPWETNPPANTKVIAVILADTHAQAASLCAQAPSYVRTIPVVL